MDLLGPGTELSFEFLDRSGNLHTPRFSLSGLMAALLWIDEQQGRIGSPRSAGHPPRGLTPVDHFGDRHVTVPPALIELHRGQEDCEPLEDIPHNTLFTAIDLGAGNTLYIVPCEGGAYNPSFAVYRNSGSGFARQGFADYSHETSWSVTSHLINPQWNDQTKTLTTFNKGRGIADCGSIGVWRLRDGYLRLERFYHKQECDGQGDPGDFPLVYQARKLPPH